MDCELSHRVAGLAEDEPQSGWHTACLALRSDSQLEKGFYVEGWTVILDSLLVIEHAWIELAGRIVDPTRWASGLAYFPALRFDKDQLLDALVDCAEVTSCLALRREPARQSRIPSRLARRACPCSDSAGLSERGCVESQKPTAHHKRA